MRILRGGLTFKTLLTNSWVPLSRNVYKNRPLVRNNTDTNHAQFPGGKTLFITQGNIIYADDFKFIPTYKVINSEGIVEEGANDLNLDKETVTKMYTSMVLLNSLDKILYESQRQGRISFYMTNFGEEGSHIGSAAALESDDLIYGQYREAGILVWRGFTLSEFIDQCYGNVDDEGRGKQMPVHYGSKKLNFVTISSPLATQIPQAVGAAYAFKKDVNNQKIVVCYFGEGAASEGDAHAAFNFASTLECPIIFFCRNNGFAISTPASEQYRGDGIAGRASGYGMATIRVDGTDVFAVYDGMKKAREYVLKNNKPIIFEAMAYRVGHHSTSDDSSVYRSMEDIEIWNTTENPINKLKNYMLKKNWWNEELEQELLKKYKKDILSQIAISEKKLKPNWKEMFEGVYDKTPKHLRIQEKEMQEHMEKYKEHYPLKMFKS